MLKAFQQAAEKARQGIDGDHGMWFVVEGPRATAVPTPTSRFLVMSADSR